MTAEIAIDTRVTVRAATPPGHIRTPMFLRGRTGTVIDVLGRFANPEELAYGRPGEPLTLYRVQFAQADLWDEYTGPDGDSVVADLYENWLEVG